MAYKIMQNNKIDKESKSLETARDKGVTSTDLLDKGIIKEQFITYLVWDDKAGIFCEKKSISSDKALRCTEDIKKLFSKPKVSLYEALKNRPDRVARLESILLKTLPLVKGSR